MLVILIDDTVAIPVFVAYITRLGSRLNLFAILIFVVVNLFLSAEDTVSFNQVEI